MGYSGNVLGHPVKELWNSLTRVLEAGGGGVEMKSDAFGNKMLMKTMTEERSVAKNDLWRVSFDLKRRG